jgi:CheY-like chemotaxis protein
MHPKSATPGYIAAGVIGLLIIADAVYGGAMQRESLISWTQILFGSLALFAMFGHRITEFVVGKDGITIKQKIEAAAALAAAEASRPDRDAPNAESPRERAQRIANVVNDAALDKGLAGKSILWVDDRPANNIYERQAMEALGIRFTISTSTEEALQMLERESFDAVISDMGRPPDSFAGYTLLDALKRRGEYPPFVIYAGSNAPEHRRETVERGGWGTTDRPQELFGLILSALQGRKRK